ncbi:hypothetical protein BpHYR1_040740 [Brachionus plicatilis]|uniref:Uncharacterized protein n=1 Tax=Brachionus plicatilis TaxID=10195 RepID=A0A3M7PDG2_BRAPC|nr:hypothetical protein BpHYR1_040740 [Brachionus plicatilis]
MTLGINARVPQHGITRLNLGGLKYVSVDTFFRTIFRLILAKRIYKISLQFNTDNLNETMNFYLKKDSEKYIEIKDIEEKNLKIKKSKKIFIQEKFFSSLKNVYEINPITKENIIMKGSKFMNDIKFIIKI